LKVANTRLRYKEGHLGYQFGEFFIIFSVASCVSETKIFLGFILILIIFIETVIGTCVHQDIICPDFTVQAVIISTTLSMRGAVNLVELLIPIICVTMSKLRSDLTGIIKGWCHVPDLVIISLACIDLSATKCIVLNPSNAANCRLKKVGRIL
jgi:hypothetical protein